MLSAEIPGILGEMHATIAAAQTNSAKARRSRNLVHRVDLKILPPEIAILVVISAHLLRARGGAANVAKESQR
jgi:hypothetical protein